MSRVLLSGDNQITWSFGKHGGWSKGIDIVRFENRLEKITVHTAGKVIKVVNYLDGTNKILVITLWCFTKAILSHCTDILNMSQLMRDRK